MNHVVGVPPWASLRGRPFQPAMLRAGGIHSQNFLISPRGSFSTPYRDARRIARLRPASRDTGVPS